MSKYLVWCPDRGQTVDDAKKVVEHDARDAAATFAEYHAGFSGDPFNEIDVRVRDESGRESDYTVTVEVAPYFYASRR